MTLRQVLSKANNITSTSPGFLAKEVSFHVHLEDELLKMCFDLVKKNMQRLYDSAGGLWTWSDAAKMAELQNEDIRFLIFRSQNQEISGFLAFCFEYEDQQPVAYVYEIQTAVQGQGLGRKLMESLEKICEELTGVRKLMLTVLRENQGARKFYALQGWIEDEDSPLDEPYVILCKFI